MKSRKSVVVSAIMVVLLLVLTAAVFVWESTPARRIPRLVLDNRSALEIIAQDAKNGHRTSDIPGGARIDGVYGGIVQFSCGGFGIAPASRYFGFYYSPEDEPVAFQNVNAALEAVSQEEWRWSDRTDNGGLTRRIAPCWYYYEAWF